MCEYSRNMLQHTNPSPWKTENPVTHYMCIYNYEIQFFYIFTPSLSTRIELYGECCACIACMPTDCTTPKRQYCAWLCRCCSSWSYPVLSPPMYMNRVLCCYRLCVSVENGYTFRYNLRCINFIVDCRKPTVNMCSVHVCVWFVWELLRKREVECFSHINRAVWHSLNLLHLFSHKIIPKSSLFRLRNKLWHIYRLICIADTDHRSFECNCNQKCFW